MFHFDQCIGYFIGASTSLACPVFTFYKNPSPFPLEKEAHTFSCDDRSLLYNIGVLERVV